MRVLVLTILIAITGVIYTYAQNPTPKPIPTPSPIPDNGAFLPPEPPPIAPNFQAPARPLPSAERVGVDLTNQLTLTLEEAIELALKNNNDIDTSRNDVQIAEFNFRGARGIYDPVIGSESYYESRTTPTASTIGGAVNGSVTQRQFFGNAGVTGFSPFHGGNYSAGFTSSRTNTSNLNATLNPQYPTDFTFRYTQPLFRGRRFDINRRNIEIARKNLSLTDSQFRQRAIEIIALVEQAYWNLAFALRNLQVQIDAVKQARLQLESNQRLVAKGVLAPIDVVAATAQIATFEQGVYTVQEDVTRAENTLKTLLLADRTADIWGRPITPVSPITLDPPRVGLEIAVAEALKNRPELTQLAASEEINKIDQRYYRDQTKPQIDLVGSYTATGLAGAATPPRTTTPSALTTRVNDLSLLAGLPVLPTGTTTSTVPPNLVGGYFNSLGNLIGQDYPTYRIGVSISLPWGNTTAKANLGRTLVESNRIANQRAKTENVIEAEVRNSLQALRSAEARLASALAARVSAEQLSESEQRQFRAGTTTLYLVLQRQNELLAARGRELQAQTDLNKAISEFQRATGTTLTANNVTVSAR
jgi:outer membrane protein